MPDDYVEGIADAMHQLTGVPAGFVMTLKSVGWHEVHSCGGGFCFAAREAMFSTRRILQVPGPSRELPTIPSRDRPQVMLVDGIAACGRCHLNLPKVQN
jgi:hypothetical protein